MLLKLLNKKYVHMKNQKFLRSLLTSVFCVGLCANAMYVQASETTNSTFEIKNIQLVGQIKLLSERTQVDLLLQLRQGGLRSMNERELSELLQVVQNGLDAKMPQRFVLSIPPQTLDDGTLSVLVQPRLMGLTVNGSSDFDEVNVRASLPSLTQGKVLQSQYWVDLRELQMANDNPLKVTTVEYEVQPDEGVRASVKTRAPYGSTQWTLGGSNTGNDATGRGQIQLNAVNANLTGQDDVLSLASGGSLNPWANTGFVALRYTLPDYAEHLSHGFEFTHSKGNTNTPFFSLNLSNQAQYNDLGYRQTHYLGDLSKLIKEAKFGVGISYITSDSNTTLSNLSLQQANIKTTPLTLTFESDFAVEPQNQSHMRIDWLTSKASLVSGDQLQQWQVLRSDVDSHYSVLRLALNGRINLNGMGALWQYRSQYSAQKLLPLMQFSEVNPFTGVRGFVNTVAQGDTGQVLRLELESTNLLDDVKLRGYGFYDVGTKKGGTDERNLGFSSHGFGLRAGSNDQRLKVDTYVAMKDRGRELDLVSGGSTLKNRTSFWLVTSYNF